MASELTVTSVVKYETIVTKYDSFTCRRIKVTDINGYVTEFGIFHTTGDPFEHVPLTVRDQRTISKGPLDADE